MTYSCDNYVNPLIRTLVKTVMPLLRALQGHILPLLKQSAFKAYAVV